MGRRTLFAVTLFLAFPSWGSAQKVYPDKPEGLKKLVENMIAENRSGTLDANRSVQALLIADNDTWFQEVFGADVGDRLATEYSSVRSDLETSLVAFLSRADANGKGRVSVLRARLKEANSRDPETLAVVSLAQKPIELYTVRFTNSASQEEVFFGQFAYRQGAFRFLGRMLAVVSGNEARLRIFPLRSNLPSLKASFYSRPRYPQAAKDARVGGTVRIYAVISLDGTLRDLRVVQGHPLLVQASLEALKGRRYQPIEIDGVRTEVLILADTIFEIRS